MARRPWLVWAALAATATLLQLGGEEAFRALRYERDALLDGELWRALTGHFVHVGWAHLASNLAVAALLTALVGRRLTAPAALACLAGVSAGLFLFAVRLAWYAGLSGALHGLALVGAARAWRASRRPAWLVFAALVAAKVAVEQLLGPSRAVEAWIGAPVAVQAHLWGAVAGLVVALAPRPRR